MRIPHTHNRHWRRYGTLGVGSNSRQGTNRKSTRAPTLASNSSTSEIGPDVAVGIVFGLLAGSNLVQGAWLKDYPLVDLTTAAFVLAIPICLASLRHRRTTISVAILILVFLLGLTLGYLEPAMSANAVLKRSNIIIGVAFVFLASYLALSNPRRIKSFLITLVSLAIPVVIGQVVAPDSLALSTGRRTPDGLNAIGAGRAVGSALVVVLTTLAVSPKGRTRWPLILLTPILGVSLYLDGSRGPIVGLIGGIIVIVWLHPTLRWFSKFALTAVIAPLTLIIYQRSVSASSRLADLTTSGRDVLYSEAVRVAAGHPLGVGWGNFNDFASPVRADQGGNLYAHNVVLEFWIEAGILGALCFSALAIAILVKSFRSARSSGIGLALAALAINLLTGAMLSSDIIGNRMMWVVFGAVLAIVIPGDGAPGCNRLDRPARGDLMQFDSQRYP